MKTRFTKVIALGVASGLISGNSAICVLADETPTDNTEVAQPTDTAEALEKAALAEEETTEYAAAGISLMLNRYYEKAEDPQSGIENMLTPQTETTENAEKKDTKMLFEKKREAYFKNLAIAKVDTYVNVRKKPTTESKIVGHIYGNNSAKILERVDGWYKISSGNVTGYVKEDFFISGEEAEQYAFENGYVLARCNVDGLYVRKNKSTDGKILTMIGKGEKVAVLEKTREWAKVAIDDDTVGWIAMKYVDMRAGFDKALTLKEEKAIQKEQEEKQKAEQESIAQSIAASQSAEAASVEAVMEASSEAASIEAEQQEQQVQQPVTTVTPEVQNENDYEQPAIQQYTTAQPSTQQYTTAKQTTTAQQVQEEYDTSDTGSSSTSGSDVVAYAMRFVGNPYVYGGSSLTNGTDCSGFTMSVYAHFGYGLSRSSAAQRSNGVDVPLSQVQPGDLICYNGHVAIYAGGGQIVHASTPATGIMVSSMYYGSTPICARRIIQ